MKKCIILAVGFLYTAALWAQDEKFPVEIKKLPNLAHNNLNAYFPNVDVIEAYTTTQKIKDEYIVVLENTVMLVFDKHGQWSRVIANDGEIPERMIDGRIKMNIAQTGHDARVIKMCKDKKGNYEICLDDGTELRYNSQFKPMK